MNLKSVILDVMMAARLDKIAIASMNRNQEGVVLMYHGLTEDDNKITEGDWLQVKVSEFKKQMRYVSENFFPTHLTNLFDTLEFAPSRPPCVITFDDGYKSVLDLALPILQKYNIPATVFLVTSTLDLNADTLFWWDKYHLAFKNFFESEVDLSESINSIKEQIPVNELPGYVNALIKNKSIELTEEQIKSYQIMNYVDLRQLTDGDLIDYGSHTHEHELLTKISNDAAKDTLQKSYEVLDEIAEKFFTNPDIFFCYPNGFFTDEHAAICKEIDYGGAVTTKKGIVSTLTNPFKIPRISIGQNTSFNLFKFHISGLSTKLRFSSN